VVAFLVDAGVDVLDVALVEDPPLVAGLLVVGLVAAAVGVAQPSQQVGQNVGAMAFRRRNSSQNSR